MSIVRPPSKRLIERPWIRPVESDHPGWDLVIYILNYVIQLFGVYSSCPMLIAEEGGESGDVSASVFALLLSTALLAADFATDAFDDDALAAPRSSALYNAFWGLAIMALANFLLFVQLAFFDASGTVFFAAWVFCLLSSLIAPACLLKHQFNLFIAHHERIHGARER